MFLIFGFDAPYVAILTIISAVIHEIGHLLAISHLAHSTAIPKGHISGFRIRRRETLTYLEEGIILAMGPLCNLIVFLFTIPFGGEMYGYIKTFGIINLATALSNLLPVEGYDGYGILMQWFAAKDKQGAIRMLDAFSFLFSVAITFLSLYFIDKLGDGYWIFVVFFVIMISKLIKYGKYDVF